MLMPDILGECGAPVDLHGVPYASGKLQCSLNLMFSLCLL